MTDETVTAVPGVSEEAVQHRAAEFLASRLVGQWAELAARLSLCREQLEQAETPDLRNIPAEMLDNFRLLSADEAKVREKLRSPAGYVASEKFFSGRGPDYRL